MEISFKNQEEISVCYFKAVAAKANTLVVINNRDENGIDASISKVLTTKDGIEYDSQINFQLKSVYSTSAYEIGPSEIHYDLKVKNYNDLIREAAIDRYLVLLILPVEKEQWVLQSEECLSIKKQMFFLSLKGKTPSSNQETVRVSIPKVNVFDCEHLLDLLQKAADGDDDAE